MKNGVNRSGVVSHRNDACAIENPQGELRFMASFGLTLANRGVIIGAVSVPELFDMAKRGEDSGAFDAVWVGDSLLAKPRLESIALLSALRAGYKKSPAGRRLYGDLPATTPRFVGPTMGEPRCDICRSSVAGRLFRRAQRAESSPSA